ncbi:MAG: Calx-beta domain-containing protein, partial [Verrucomicrobiota bacterium]|nr:Calx-beta domain-containing protein [Verrucomicrobiota bacterium]
MPTGVAVAVGHGEVLHIIAVEVGHNDRFGRAPARAVGPEHVHHGRGGEQFALGRVEFRAPRIEYDEGAATYELKIIRSGKVQEPVTVQYKTVDGTAKQGEDFTAAT